MLVPLLFVYGATKFADVVGFTSWSSVREPSQVFILLERLYSAKLDLDTHYAWQTVLRTWLWLHVPAAVLLLVLVAIHIATVLIY